MGAFKKILLAYDGSPHSQTALQMAINIAQCSRAEIQVVYAYDKVPAYLGEPNLQAVINKVVITSEEIAQKVVEQIEAAGITASANVLEGPAAEAILKVADSEPFDLIVMGSRGLGELQGLLLGSVSDRVMHHAKIPVLIVR